MEQKHVTIAALILLTVLLATLLFSEPFVSMTWDEPQHIAAGYSKLVTGDFRMNTEHPPLMNLLQALPLLLLKPTLDLTDYSWMRKHLIDFTQKFFFESNKNPRQLLTYARMPIILLTVLLGWLVFSWTKKLFGNTAALLALFLYTLEPNILGHGVLATTDMGFTFFAFLAVYRYWQFFEIPSTKNLIIASITMGLVQLSKYTAILLWPLSVFIIFATIKTHSPTKLLFAYPFQKTLENHRLKHLYFHLISLCIIGLISLFIINAAYLFHGTGVPLKQALLADTTIDPTLFSPETVFGQNPVLNFIAENMPSPLPYYYTKGLGFVIMEGRSNHPSFILGKLYERGTWHYFIFAFAVKTTIAMLVLLLLALVLPQHKKKTARSSWQFLVLPILVILFALSSATKQTGIRYVLAIFPFLIVWVCGRLVTARIKRNNYVLGAFFIILFAHALSSLAAFPHYLSYYNEFVGTGNSVKIFVDSNTDWGQDFDALVAYVHQHPQTRVQYFGTNNLAYYNISQNKAPPFCAYEMLAISDEETTNPQFTWLDNYTPSGRIGTSILLYNVTHCPPRRIMTPLLKHHDYERPTTTTPP